MCMYVCDVSTLPLCLSQEMPVKPARLSWQTLTGDTLECPPHPACLAVSLEPCFCPPHRRNTFSVSSAPTWAPIDPITPQTRSPGVHAKGECSFGLRTSFFLNCVVMLIWGEGGGIGGRPCWDKHARKASWYPNGKSELTSSWKTYFK